MTHKTIDEKAPVSPDFNTAGSEGQWSIVLGGIPINIHFEEKTFLGVPMDPLSWIGLNNLMKGTNHNYIEIRGPKSGEHPEGQVYRRIQGQEANMSKLESMMSGRMLAASYGSKELSFAKDEVLHDDRNENHPDLLRSGDNPKQTGAVFTGTKLQVLSLYYSALGEVIRVNNMDLPYNSQVTGNTVVSEVIENMEETAEKHGWPMQEFTPEKKNQGYDPNKLTTPVGEEVPFKSEAELLAAISEREKAISAQYFEIKSDEGVDLETPVPGKSSAVPEANPDNRHAELDDSGPKLI